MSDIRTIKDIQTDFNQKLHTLGTLKWQLEEAIPNQMAEVEQDLRQIEKEYKLAVKMEAKKAEQAKKNKMATEQNNQADIMPEPEVSMPDGSPVEAQPAQH